ncbi:MAG: DNA primase [Candidatus Kapabacteria bacterium]|nr:DNA primase [Candidatus Kapabacteria bacterium]
MYLATQNPKPKTHLRIPQHIIEQVRQQSDIVDVIGEHVKLRKNNRNYIGLCPFHKEKTPSFNVNAERGIFKCFGCGKAGNVITFVEQHMHMGFVDAVRHLAQRAGIEIPDQQRDDPTGEFARQDNAMRALREATEFYQHVLGSSDGAPARAFFTRRGFSEQTCTDFRLGAAPAAWDATMQHLLSRGYSIEHLVDAGLVITREDGKTYDRFRGRAMFAIADVSGRVVGFSARTLTDDPGQPKYVNSPQSIVFEKSKLLYGLDRAKRAIQAERTAILVEGQADVITLHQAGITNVVASSGTALTSEHLRILKRFADTIVLVFDSDEAGQKAITKGIELALAAGYDVRCVVLPAGTDPDSLVRDKGADALRTLIDQGMTWLTYQVDRLRSKGQLDDATQQAKAVRTMLEWIASVPDTLRHPFLIRDVADAFRLNEQVLSQELQRVVAGSAARPVARVPDAPVRQSSGQAPSSTAPTVPADKPTYVAALLPSERELIRTMLSVPDALAIALNEYHVTPESFWSEGGRIIFRSILVGTEEHADASEYVLHDPSLTSEQRRELADMMFAASSPSLSWKQFDVEVPGYDIHRTIRDSLVNIEIHRVHQRIDASTQSLESMADVDERKRIMFRIAQLITRREELRGVFNTDPSDISWLHDDQTLRH